MSAPDSRGEYSANKVEYRPGPDGGGGISFGRIRGRSRTLEHMKPRYVLVAAIAASLLLVGCAGDRTGPDATGGPTSVGTHSEGVTASPTSTVTDSTEEALTPAPPKGEDEVVVPPNASTERKMLPPVAGSQLVITEIRTATHPGLDRVVLEFAGEGQPGWTVEYVDRAESQGSGNQVPVEGSSILRIEATGTTNPQPGEPTVPQRIPGGDNFVTEVVSDGIFEGSTVAFVGLSTDPKPFDVQVLQNPTRLVVDIVH